MKSITIQGRSTADIRSALDENMADGFRPSLAIVFLSAKPEREAICNLLQQYDIRIFGASTSAEFINSEICENGIAIMLLDINPSDFSLLFFELGDSDPQETARIIGKKGKELFSNPSFIITSGWLHSDGQRIIQGINEGSGTEATVFGAMAGDDITTADPFIFTENACSHTGLMAIILNEDRISMKGIATCGWKPIGITKTITKSEGNIVYTIDHEPALDLVARYLGLDIDQESADSEIIVLGAFYPLQVEREEGPPVMRSASLGNKKDRSLICSGYVHEGSKFKFSLPPDFDVIDTVVSECTEMKNAEQPSADAVIMFSCISRHLAFGILASEEIERIENVWKAPFIGFFSYGEFGRSKNGKYEFHNNTCCLVALKEKTP